MNRIKRENDIAILVSISAQLAEKEHSREELRDYCREHDIKFNLRNTKLELAGKVYLHIAETRPGDIEELAYKAKDRWCKKIESGDKHKPWYYLKMFDLSNRLVEMIERMKGALENA